MTIATPEGCRSLAAECGRRANQFASCGDLVKAGREKARQQTLTVLAAKLEQDIEANQRKEMQHGNGNA